MIDILPLIDEVVFTVIESGDDCDNVENSEQKESEMGKVNNMACYWRLGGSTLNAFFFIAAGYIKNEDAYEERKKKAKGIEA